MSLLDRVNTPVGMTSSFGTVTLAAVSTTQEHISWLLAVGGAFCGLVLVIVSIRNALAQSRKDTAEVLAKQAEARASEALARRERLQSDLLEMQIHRE